MKQTILVASATLMAGLAIGYLAGSPSVSSVAGGGSGGSGSQHTGTAGGAAGATATPAGQAADAEAEQRERRGEILSGILAASKLGNDLDKIRRIVALVDKLGPGDMQAALQLTQKLTGSDMKPMTAVVVAKWADYDPKAAALFAISKEHESGWDRDETIGLTAAAWARKEPNEARAWANGLKSGAERNAAVAGVAAGMVETNPAQALAWIQSIKTTIDPGIVYPEFFEAWARVEPASAAAEAAATNTSVLNKVIEAWARIDPASAISWAKSLPNPAMRADTIVAALYEWGKSDPKAAIASAASLPGDPLRGKSIRESLAERLAETDPAAAFAMIQELPLSDSSGTTRASILITFARSDPQTAAQAAMDISGNEAARELALGRVFATWADRAPAEAIAFARERLRGDDQSTALSESLQKWASSEPDKAFALASSIGKAHLLTTTSSIDDWARRDPRGALAWVQTNVQGSTRGQMESIALVRLADSAPAEAAKHFQSLPAGDIQAQVGGKIGEGFANSNVEAGMRWLDGLKDKVVVASAAESFAGKWAQADSERTTAWIESLPSGAMKDAALGGLALTTLNEDMKAAATLAESIGNPDMRSEKLGSIYSRWNKADPASAARWLSETSALNAETKRQFQEANNPSKDGKK